MTLTDRTGSLNIDTDQEIYENEEEEVIDDSEERELVNDPCSTKVLDGRNQPVDKYWIVYILFYLFGVTSLVPWNFLITANDYWMYKFRDVTPNNLTYGLRKTQFQAEFTSYLNVAMAIPNLLFLILNSLYGHLIPVRQRLLGSLVVVSLTFIITTVLVPINTDDWQNTFFIITMTNVVVMTAGMAIFIASLVGLASKFSSEYMTAVVGGQALGGIIAALAQIISLAFKISPLHSALIYFLTADFLVIGSLLAYLWMFKLEFFAHYALNSSEGVALNRHRSVSMVGVMKKIWVFGFCIFAIFAITMCVYPAVTVLVESHPVTTGTDWNNIFFVPVVNYLIFNCGDYAGRLSSGFLRKPTNQWVVAGLSMLRIVCVPLLMLCNARPRKHLPIIFMWDWEFILIMIFFAFSNGYLTNIVMVQATRIVEPHEREKASSAVATMLTVGLTVGAAISMLLVRLL